MSSDWADDKAKSIDSALLLYTPMGHDSIERRRIIATALREAARVPECNASSLLAEVLEECGIRTGTTIDRKDLENMAASLAARLAATSAAARGVGQVSDTQCEADSLDRSLDWQQ